MTPRDPKRKDDAKCFYEGYRAGRRGELMRSPHPIGSHESWSWTGGWIEGKQRHHEDTVKLDTKREH
jgi:hypothetical protein